MDEISKVALDEFERKPDGTWVCVKNSDINTKLGRVIRVPPGTIFRKGATLAGIDVAAGLDQIAAAAKN